MFNKMIINTQYASSINIYISFLDLNWFLVFGFTGISLFFCILVNFLITICMLVNYENEFSYKSFNLLLWFLEIILILFFTTNDIILFFIFFELSLIPIFLIIII